MGRAGKALIAVGLFAMVMAYIESAIVVYLRALYGIEDLLQDLPRTPDQYTVIEIGREACTLVMLVLIGWLAGRNKQDRIGYAVFAFGLWDIFYYGWLAVFIGWPRTLLDWDVLFLIPLPWWGPVLSPMLIALLMVVGGGIAVLKADRNQVLRFSRVDWCVGGIGTLVALAVFMSDALYAMPSGMAAVANARPTVFNWALFIMALMGMAFFLFHGLVQARYGSK